MISQGPKPCVDLASLYVQELHKGPSGLATGPPLSPLQERPKDPFMVALDSIRVRDSEVGRPKCSAGCCGRPAVVHKSDCVALILAS
jgi:hypothetical protein